MCCSTVLSTMLGLTGKFKLSSIGVTSIRSGFSYFLSIALNSAFSAGVCAVALSNPQVS